MPFRPEFAEIVREHQAMVYSMAYHALRDREAAEDLTQEVFLALHENLSRLASHDHLRHWLIRVTARKCIDQIRKRSYRRGPSLDDAPEPATPARQFDALLERELRQMIATLPPRPRMMLILRYQEDLPLAEIARLLEIPLDTVKSRLHRSVRLLRAKMARRETAIREGARP